MIPWRLHIGLVPLLVLLLARGIPAAGLPANGAQLDLPGKSRPTPKDPAEELLPPSPPKGDLAPREDATPLDLPAAPGAGAAPPAADAPSDGGPEAAARALFRELARARETRLVAPVLERLLALGPGILPVARAQLESDHGPILLAAGHVCLLAGQSADRAAVAERLLRALPADVGAALLEELLRRDPMLSSPEYLAGLLDHPGAVLRSGAFKALEARLASVPLQVLAPLLSSTRTATRSAALELIARSPDPLAWNLLASRLGDTSAQLARRAADLLAGIDGAETLLLERAFPGSGPLDWDRARAYALLGLVEREEARGQALLEGARPSARIEVLRAGLTSVQPLVAGACAVALARLGFRSTARSSGAWLQLEVPHQLVRCGTGAEFHGDFSSLERPALRALGLLTGEAFGADGEAWRRWWLEHAGGFRARHARIELTPQAAGELLVSFRDADGRSLWLCGPARAAPRGVGPVLRLDQAAAERLRTRLESEGVFGVERLPGMRASGEWALSVAVGEQEKGFNRPAGGDTSWLDGLCAELERLAEENRWQLYFDPETTNALEWWQSEHERWAPLAPLARRRALATLLIAVARRAPPGSSRVGAGRRDELVSELTRLYGDAGVPEAADFEPLLGVLAGESVFGPRAAGLCELARVAAGAAGNEAPESAPRERLIALVLERFGPEADPVLARVGRDLEPETLALFARDARPRARSLAAAGLLRALERMPEGPVLLQGLLADPEPSVQLAVLRALAANPPARLPDAARAELFVRARSGTNEPRALALAALARLGGKDVHDLALEAVGDSDDVVQFAGVAALAELADPRSASLLASLLARGPSSPHHEAARRGLLRMGASGREECLRLARSAGARARREAALLLSAALAPEAAGMLVTLLAEDPSDERVRWELAVLSGLDLGAEEHPEQAASGWWDLVVHDDAMAWLLAAAERAGLPAPGRAALAEPPGASQSASQSAEGARFLLALANLPQPHLVERAVRELELRLETELRRPGTAEERAQFRVELQEAVRARFGE